MKQATSDRTRIASQLIPVRDSDGGVTLYANGDVAFYVHGGDLFEALRGPQSLLKSDEAFRDIKSFMFMSTDGVSTS